MRPSFVRDLQSMISGMEPVLDEVPYHFVSDANPALAPKAFGMVREAEGVTWIIPADAQPDHGPHFARITLQVHSDLSASGLTAAVATALASEDIACNVVAAFHHDHLFVPWERREEALAILNRLSDDARR
ncbi:MAG: ACT domain-containing protein [Pseudomonadota bacterium]